MALFFFKKKGWFSFEIFLREKQKEKDDVPLGKEGVMEVY